MPNTLEAALDALPVWLLADPARPNEPLRQTRITPLAGGHSNHSYLLHCGSQKCVLRINHQQPSTLGISRRIEADILSALAPLNIAPKLLYTCPQYSFSVFEYLQGRVWQWFDFLQLDQRRRLQRVVEQYRRCKLSLTPLDYTAYLENYWQQFQNKKPAHARALARPWHGFIRQLRLYQKRTQGRCLVHHDLVAGNIIDTRDGLKIIDWEYAGLGFAGLDDAAVGKFFRPSAALARRIKKGCRLKKSSDAFLGITGKNTAKFAAAADGSNKAIINQLMFWLDFLWWEIR